MEHQSVVEKVAARTATPGKVSRSPFGPDDQIGMLNLMTDESRAAAWAAADPTTMYDISVDYHVGMP
ncbi:MAG: cyclase family protein, partial [Comamonadaceae bacterium]